MGATTTAAVPATPTVTIHNGIISCVKADAYDKVEVNFSALDNKCHRIANDFSKIEASAFLIFPQMIEKALVDPSICNAAADVAEFLANKAEDIDCRSISKILANAETTFEETPDTKEHDFYRHQFTKIALTDRAIEKLRKFNEANGDL